MNFPAAAAAALSWLLPSLLGVTSNSKPPSWTEEDASEGSYKVCGDKGWPIKSLRKASIRVCGSGKITSGENRKELCREYFLSIPVKSVIIQYRSEQMGGAGEGKIWLNPSKGDVCLLSRMLPSHWHSWIICSVPDPDSAGIISYRVVA